MIGLGSYWKDTHFNLPPPQLPSPPLQLLLGLTWQELAQRKARVLVGTLLCMEMLELKDKMVSSTLPYISNSKNKG